MTMVNSSSSTRMCVATNSNVPEAQHQKISQKLKKTIELASIEMNEGRCFKLDGEPIADGVKPEVFNQLAEAFPSIKMGYDSGRIFIIEIQGRGHQAVISKISKQFGNFSNVSLLRNTFDTGGGLTPTYVCEDGMYRKLDEKADPDEGLKVFLHGKLVFRLIFEVEIHNRNFVELHQRMKALLGGWPDCLIGVACKFFPRKEGGDFEGVVFVYYKRDGVVALEKVKDIGTVELSVAHQTSLRHIRGNVEIENPEPEERFKIIQLENEMDTLESLNPDFYRIELDSNLLYHGTKFENMPDERPSLALDFLEITEGLHRQEGKLFSGLSPI